MSTNLDSLILNLAEQTSTELDESDISILRKAAKVLRKDCLQCMKSNIISFQGSVTHDASETPSYLVKFLLWLLGGKRLLEESVDTTMEGKCLTTANNILYNMVSDRQASYVTKRTHRGRPKFYTKQAIGMALTMKQYDRNNHVIKLTECT